MSFLQSTLDVINNDVNLDDLKLTKRQREGIYNKINAIYGDQNATSMESGSFMDNIKKLFAEPEYVKPSYLPGSMSAKHEVDMDSLSNNSDVDKLFTSDELKDKITVYFECGGVSGSNLNTALLKAIKDKYVTYEKIVRKGMASDMDSVKWMEAAKVLSNGLMVIQKMSGYKVVELKTTKGGLSNILKTFYLKYFQSMEDIVNFFQDDDVNEYHGDYHDMKDAKVKGDEDKIQAIGICLDVLGKLYNSLEASSSYYLKYSNES